MIPTAHELAVPRGAHRLYAEVTPGTGVPLVLMHGFPDNTHLYDRLMPHLAGRHAVVRFDFLGWGRSDKPRAYPYTATNQVAAAQRGRAVVRRRPDLDRRPYAWQVGGFIRDPEIRDMLVTQLYADFLPARPAFWPLNDDPSPAVLTRLRHVDELRRFVPPVRVIFGARDRYLNTRVARRFAALFPNSELHLLPDAGH
ncbi:alpha/beta fold hydrolase [Micromonospora globispora]|uniref:alpha/beta fold hydrolase n=1 Tax=Micromonospora globispora TaxID=1450148 RepID=UPI001A9C3EAF|nr:alpha/beta fold hydrolase [Micromonospora globispora]